MMKNIPYVDLDYCQFSDWGYKKPTRFWGSINIGKLPSVRCPGRECKNVVVSDDGFRHKEKLGGNKMKFSTVLKGRIPSKVVDYLLQEGEFSKVAPKRQVRRQKDKGYKMAPALRTRLFVYRGYFGQTGKEFYVLSFGLETGFSSTAYAPR